MCLTFSLYVPTPETPQHTQTFNPLLRTERLPPFEH